MVPTVGCSSGGRDGVFVDGADADQLGQRVGEGMTDARDHRGIAPRSGVASDIHIALLGRFALRVDGVAVAVAPSAQRLLAFLGVHGRCARDYVAGVLWPELADGRALASLRTAVWRVRSLTVEALSVTHRDIGLHPRVAVDLHAVIDAAKRVPHPNQAGPTAVDVHAIGRVLTRCGELLPGWYDDWVVLERERTRLLRVRALEALAERLLGDGATSDALQVAMTATVIEPFRDSAHAAVLRAYVSEGNSAQALEHYLRYRTLLHDELGVEPSPELALLVPHVAGRMG